MADDAREDDMLEVLERHDRFAQVRNGLRRMAEKVGEYAGLPMPLDGEDLVIHPSYKFAEAIGGKRVEPEADGRSASVRNVWWSHARRCQIIMGEIDGKFAWGVEPGFHHIGYDLRTLGCSDAWGIEQEAKAIHLLGTLVRHHTFKQYLLTGMFLETSARSGITYMFRRLKPTVAMTLREEDTRILAVLCQHTIAHYAGSWAGALCPTDDVIASLMMMRGDEALFWRRCNQHAPDRPEAGL